MDYRAPVATLRYLDETEAMTFAVLARALVAADGQVDEEERDALQHAASEYGEDAFWALMDRAAEQVPGPEALGHLVSRVQRPTAREVIFGALIEVAIAGAIHPSEDAVLAALAKAWGLETHDAPEG